MCATDRRATMREEEKRIRAEVVIGLETLLTDPNWAYLLETLTEQVEAGHMCGAAMHALNAHYGFGPQPVPVR